LSRTPFLAGNWKLNLGPEEAASLASSMKECLNTRGSVEVAFFPTALSITSVIRSLEGSGIYVGIQDIHTEPGGAFTGANSSLLARQAGCTMALVGHSERRHVFNETDEQTKLKVQLAMQSGLIPILCVGETLAERQAGQAQAVVQRQLAAALCALTPSQIATTIIAYEPVWAIGTGHTATPEQAQQVHAAIRAWLGEEFPAFVAEQTRLLYGGSVKPGNAAALLQCDDIDGALVGGASLKAELFESIVKAAIQ